MNTHTKGVRNEKLLEDYFINQGIWNIQASYKAPHGRFMHDIFNVFDGVAIDLNTDDVIFWQMKSNIKDYYMAKQKLREFRKHFLMDNPKAKVVIFIFEMSGNVKRLRSFEVGNSLNDEGYPLAIERFVYLKAKK